MTNAMSAERKAKLRNLAIRDGDEQLKECLTEISRLEKLLQEREADGERLGWLVQYDNFRKVDFSDHGNLVRIWGTDWFADLRQAIDAARKEPKP
jgi:hypothetical protein